MTRISVAPSINWINFNRSMDKKLEPLQNVG